MKHPRTTRTVWVLADDKPSLARGDRRKNVVHYVHYHDPESGTSMHMHTDEEHLDGAMEFETKQAAEYYHLYTIRGHHSRNLKATQVTITTSYKFA